MQLLLYFKEGKIMCGFTGYISQGNVNNTDVIKSMADRIKHRGPDRGPDDES